MEGILALMIPVLAMATGLVAVLRMPPERLGGGKRRAALPEESAALADEVAMLREELARLNERVDFTERLLMDAAPAQRLAAPAPADPLARTIGA
jgi:ubiquinone biosynthesis protein UbiJ